MFTVDLDLDLHSGFRDRVCTVRLTIFQQAKPGSWGRAAAETDSAERQTAPAH